ncbi:MAG: hypothetical protein V1702_05640 [Candidatus Woesearchaeota archaeon]
MGKRGYFFTIDAFIAMLITTIGVVLVYLAYTSVPDVYQQQAISQDVMTIFSTTELNTLNSEYIDEQRISGNITNMQNTIFEQIAEMYDKGIVGEAQNMTREMSASLIPSQYYYEIWLDSKLMYNKSYVTNDIEQISVAKVILVGSVSLATLWGPYEGEVFVWR